MKQLSFIFIFLLFSFSVSAQIPAQKNLSLVGHLSLANRGKMSNLWGYTAPDGTEYAIVCTEQGTSIVSLADPSNPVEVQYVAGAASIWREVKTFSHYAYVVTEGGNKGLQIINLENLPNSVTSKDTVIMGVMTAHTISESEGFLYLNGSEGIRILDVNNDPWRPKYVGKYAGYVHDSYVRGNTIYSADISPGVLALVDITDKANPQKIGIMQTPHLFTHSTWLNDAGNICFAIDEIFGSAINAYNVSDPTNIQYVSQVRTHLQGGKGCPHNIYVLNDFAVVSYYQEGVVLFDVSNPNAMIEVGYYDTSPLSSAANTVEYKGCWGVYPYFNSKNIIATDIEQGLFVLKPTYTRAIRLEGTITDAETNLPLNNVLVEMENTKVSSDNTGYYQTGFPDMGTYQVTYTKKHYLPKTITVSLQNGQMTTQNVALTPIKYAFLHLEILDKETNQLIKDANVMIEDSNGLIKNYPLTKGLLRDSLAIGTYHIKAQKWGYIYEKMTFEVNDSSLKQLFLTKQYYDDFSFKLGWTVNTSYYLTGGWIKGEPIGTHHLNNIPANPEFDVETDDGNECFMTGNNATNANQNDVDEGYVELRSPAFNLTNYKYPKIYYHWWFFNQEIFSNTVGNDTFRISISNGQTTQLLRKYGHSQGGWQLDSIELNGIIPLSENMQLILHVADKAPEHIVEAAFDKFWIVEGEAPKLIDSTFSFAIYPNPSKDNFKVKYNFLGMADAIYRMEIYDTKGMKLTEYIFENEEGISVISQDFPQGLYLIVLRQNEKVISTLKIVKE